MITLHLTDQIIKSLSRPELELLKYAYENAEEILTISIQDLSARVSDPLLEKFSERLNDSPIFFSGV